MLVRANSILLTKASRSWDDVWLRWQCDEGATLNAASTCNTYLIVLKGTQQDHLPGIVAIKLAKLASIRPETARRLLEKTSTVIKRGIDADQARRYSDALTEIGCACEVQAEDQLTLDIDPELLANGDTSSAPIAPTSNDAHKEERVNITASEMLFSFDGRVGRITFLKYWLLLWMGGLATLFVLVGLVPGLSADTGKTIVGVLILWPTFAVWIKRLHDRNRPGIFFLLIFIPVIGIWVLVETFFLRGTKGVNRFGPQP